MPNVQLQLVGRAPPVAPSATARFTRARVDGPRGVGDPASDSAAAIPVSCRQAAIALPTGRVSLWYRDAAAGAFRCLHVRGHLAGSREAGHDVQDLALDDPEFVPALTGVRTIRSIRADTAAPGVADRFRDYLARGGRHAMLMAPAYFEDELQAMICHESTDRARRWTHEEIPYAASRGDHVAMACEIVRRRRAGAEVGHLRLQGRSTGLGENGGASHG